MSLKQQLQQLCDARELKYDADERGNLIVPMTLAQEQKILVVLSVDNEDNRVTFTSLQVLNANDYVGLIEPETLYHFLLRFNWNVKIGGVQLDEDGEVRFEYSLRTNDGVISGEQFDYIFRAIIATSVVIRKEVSELASNDVVPEALQSVYRSHKLTLQSDDVDTIQLSEIKAVFEGFLAAGFPEPFNALLKRDLSIIAGKVDELVPNEF